MTIEDCSPLKGFCWLRPSDFLRAMAKQNDLPNILGGFTTIAQAAPMLEEFWKRYRVVYPEFQYFQRVDSGFCSYRQSIPLYLHGDEGVTYKRGGVLIMSFQSPFGWGTSRRCRDMSLKLESLGESGLPLNFLKCGMLTRMVMVICPKECSYCAWFPTKLCTMCLVDFFKSKTPPEFAYHVLPLKDQYKDDPRVWKAILLKVASEFQTMETVGIELDGQGLVYPIILGNKGDWSYLVTYLD